MKPSKSKLFRVLLPAAAILLLIQAEKVARWNRRNRWNRPERFRLFWGVEQGLYL